MNRRSLLTAIGLSPLAALPAVALPNLRRYHTGGVVGEAPSEAVIPIRRSTTVREVDVPASDGGPAWVRRIPVETTVVYSDGSVRRSGWAA